MRNLIARLIHAIRRQADVPPEPEYRLNRKQRRDLARMKEGEMRMRAERTAMAQAKRRKSSKGDHGAKARRAYLAGREWGLKYTIVKIQQAYAAGLRDGKRQRRRFWWPRKAAA